MSPSDDFQCECTNSDGEEDDCPEPERSRGRVMLMKRHTLTNCLRAAADLFEDSAQDQPERIAAQFKEQARQAHAMADEAETAALVRLED